MFGLDLDLSPEELEKCDIIEKKRGRIGIENGHFSVIVPG